MLFGIFGLEPKDLNVEMFFLFDRHFFAKNKNVGFNGGLARLIDFSKETGNIG